MEAEYPHAQVRRLDIATALIDGLVLQLHTSPWMPRRWFDWDDTVQLSELFLSESLEAQYGTFCDQRFVDYLARNFRRIDEIHWRKFEDRIISGHHRVEAAMKAGIVEADCLSIEGEVDEGRLTAIQLSHNSLASEDDPEVLRQMLESLLPLEQAYAAVLDMEVPKPPPLRPSIGTPDTVTVAVTFTPPDVEEIRRVADLSLFAQIEPLDQMRDFLEAVDANYGLPLAHVVTTASRNDSPELPTVFAKTEGLYPWFHPSAVIADRGYDSAANHEFLRGKEALPIIHIRRKARGGLYEGIYTKKGVPTCLGQIPMEYVKSDPERGHLYRCNPKGCRLAGSMRGGIRHCDTEVWEDPTRNVRLFGAIRRDGPEWKALYAKRQAIERVFKSMKESRRLERHCIRGLRQITLHAMMSALAFQATALVKLRTGQAEMMRWMVRKVA